MKHLFLGICLLFFSSFAFAFHPFSERRAITVSLVVLVRCLMINFLLFAKTTKGFLITRVFVSLAGVLWKISTVNLQ